MAIKYRVRTKPDNIGKRETPKYYAVPVQRGVADIKVLSERLAERSSMSRSDVYGVIIGLVPLIEEYLHDGYAVKIDELGIFSLSASSEGFDTPEECTPHLVHAKKICFRADKQLKKQLKNVKFERDKKV
ncbi:MAG: DNA-binding protein [Bacteroidetes bacterium]|nr:DNA-binding protein [Bacteroidota bacterium]